MGAHAQNGFQTSFQLTEAEFKRKNAGIEAGLHGVVAVPIRTNNDDNEVDAVLCFATNSNLDRDERRDSPDSRLRHNTSLAQLLGINKPRRCSSTMHTGWKSSTRLTEESLKPLHPSCREAALKYSAAYSCERVILGLVDDATRRVDRFLPIAMDGVTELGQGTRVRIPRNWLDSKPPA